MNSVFRNLVENQIRSLHENGFQDFVNELFLTVYGENFTPLKDKRDKGCDGILFNDTVLAVYAPAKYTLAKFKRKIQKDFREYEKHWAGSYPKWQLVFNGEFTAEMIQAVDDLKSDAAKIGRLKIMALIQDLNWSAIEKIARYLQLDNKQIIYDAIETVVADLIRSKNNPERNFDFSKRTKIEEKIEINFSGEDIGNIKSEIGDCLKYFSLVQDVIGSYEQSKIDVLKSRVRTDIEKFSGDFKIREPQELKLPISWRNSDVPFRQSF